MSVRASEAGDRLTSAGQMRDDVLAGLGQVPKTLAPKYFYDAEGAKLFDQICATPEYYITRTEEGILREIAGELGRLVGRGAWLIEPGAGNSRKVRLLLDALRPSVYTPVEICPSYLETATRELKHAFPWLAVRGACGDFTERFHLPFAAKELRPVPRVMFFPGSTIGNFEPGESIRLLRQMAELLGEKGVLIVGVDLHKDVQLLEAAYNDAAGYTAAFNRNLLRRINRELGGAFEVERFAHQAFYNERQFRIEMHLVSEGYQEVEVSGQWFSFEAGETIHTENSYKYTVAGFRRLAAEAGFKSQAFWSDSGQLFSVQVFQVAE